MLVILYQDGCEAIAVRAAADVGTAFMGHLDLQALAANAPAAWPRPESWDDLLVIVYNGDGFPGAGNHFVEEFVQQRPGRAMLLPVAVDPAFRRPPGLAAGIKALEYDAAAPGSNGRAS
jgi:hypothetical protein